jgi:hypothetical protein
MTVHQNIDQNKSIQIADPQPKPKNALVHGVYSEDVVLPGEDKAAFEALARQYREDFNPDGAFEEDIVGEITHLKWIRRRLLRAYRVRAPSTPGYAPCSKRSRAVS